MSYALRKQPVFWRSPSFGIVAALHVAGLVALVQWEIAQPDSVILQVLSVRMVEAEAKPVPPRPLPVEVPRPTPRSVVRPAAPVLTAATEAPSAPAAFTVAPQPPPPKGDAAPAAPVAPAPAALPLAAARFDADYLQNPKPLYPPMSRRLGEEGKVILRVRVAASGAAQEVEVKQGSGFARLDAAARDAVSRWRFVPARRGDEAVESWVAVPIQFALES